MNRSVRYKMTSLSTAQRREQESATKLQDVQRQLRHDIGLLNYILPDVNQMLDGSWNFGTLEQETLKWNRTIDIAKEMIEFNKQKRNYEHWSNEVTRFRGIGVIRNERRRQRANPYSNDVPRLLRSRSITAPPAYEDVVGGQEMQQ